jgi:hypothetical protein
MKVIESKFYEMIVDTYEILEEEYEDILGHSVDKLSEIKLLKYTIERKLLDRIIGMNPDDAEIAVLRNKDVDGGLHITFQIKWKNK